MKHNASQSTLDAVCDRCRTPRADPRETESGCAPEGPGYPNDRRTAYPAISGSSTNCAVPSKSGYRNVSPLFNGLETSANLITGGLLRPIYGDSVKKNPDGTALNSNMFYVSGAPEWPSAQSRILLHLPCGERDEGRGRSFETRSSGDPHRHFIPPRPVPAVAGLSYGGFGGTQIILQRSAILLSGALPSLSTAGVSCGLLHKRGLDLT